MPALGWRKPLVDRVTKPREPRRTPAPSPAPSPAEAESERLQGEENPFPFLHGNHPAHELSITVAKRGGHAPDLWWLRMCVFADEICDAAALSTEAGKRMKHLHIQMVARIRCDGSAAGLKKLANHIRNFIPCNGQGGTIQAKLLMATQTFQLMVGYVQKCFGEPFYKLHLKGVTESEAANARQAYGAVSIDPMAGRKVITKSNVSG